MAESLISSELSAYLDALAPPRHEELAAMEERARRDRFPILGPAATQCCYVLARLMGARTVFELGSGFGYSTAFFARAVKENGGGTVHHVVWDEELSNQARASMKRLGLDDTVAFHVGEAVETLRQTAGPFDLIFNDIDKDQYPASLPPICDKLRPGGALLVDNMLWSGRIFDDGDTSAATEGVRELTRLLQADDRWSTTLLPIRDGVMLAYRR